MIVPKDYEIIKSKRTNKKYDVIKNGSYLLSFGDSRYGQYKDVTPTKAYSSLNHLDKERRSRYYARHGQTNDMTSPKWWSHYFLWPM
jgi:hypothetical protein